MRYMNSGIVATKNKNIQLFLKVPIKRPGCSSFLIYAECFATMSSEDDGGEGSWPQLSNALDSDGAMPKARR